MTYLWNIDFCDCSRTLRLAPTPKGTRVSSSFFVKYCLTAFNGILCFIDDKKKNIFMMRKNTIKDKAFHNNNKKTMKRPLI